MNRGNFIKATAYGLIGGTYLKSLPAYSTLTNPQYHLIASLGDHKLATKQKSPTKVEHQAGGMVTWFEVT
ncbi:MAG: hypothetical protein HOM14_18255 [Gammaproteobacteria bacterium]|jgi:hypothetical protein|nr:hypothetical protein [Gammaproteobacteria bacterium]MBT3722696.1 hypothetical protein [Gammaproteobacteria bacterium]MBT4078972.1 hypothetical protein [Gammaproteobacteria bacterium]MBT4194699.1 hypothetical protein [Gammaproteobacteria bacterium]MBT4450769.1 hypothetical protein [Gammaproteobacteria bacterium]